MNEKTAKSLKPGDIVLAKISVGRGNFFICAEIEVADLSGDIFYIKKNNNMEYQTSYLYFKEIIMILDERLPQKIVEQNTKENESLYKLFKRHML